MTDWSGENPAEAAASLLDRSENGQYSITPQTRRTILRSLAAGASVAALGTGISGAVQDEDEKPGPQFQDALDWITRTQLNAGLSAGPTDQECPPTTFTEKWVSDDLEGNITQVVPRQGSSENDPVFAVGGDNIAFEGNSKIYAFDRETGSILPNWPIPTDRFTQLLPGPKGTLFYMNASTDESTWRVASVDVDAASKNWEQSFERDGTLANLLYDEARGELHAVTSGPTVTAFDSESGDELWSWSANQGIPAFLARRAEDTLYIVATPFIAADIQSRFSALDLSSSGKPTEKWHLTDDKTMPVFPAVGPDFVAIGLADIQNKESEIRVLEADDGTERWRDTRDDGLLYNGFLLAQNGGVYGTASFDPDSEPPDGELWKFDAEDGTVKWSFDADGYVLGLELGPNSAYIQTDSGDVYAIKDDTESSDGGGERWSQTLITDSESSISGAFTLDCDTLYTGTTEKPGTVYAIDAENGNIHDEYTVGSGVVRFAASLGDSVWAVSGKGVDQTDEDVENRVYRLVGNSNEDGDDTVSVSVEPDDVGMDVDGTTQANLQVTGAEAGIGEYTLSISVEDLGVATISDVSVDRLDSGGVDIEDDGSSATLDVDLGTDPYEQEAVTVATVTLLGVGTGETTLGYDSVSVVGSSGTTQEIQSTTGAIVTVPGSQGPPPVIGDQQPSDPDGDGLYEDIDGDGEFTISDVSQFFESYNSDLVQENAEFFNFEGSDDGTVTLADVQALYSKYKDD
jgi:outer membrane protein assembly factor BamB